MAEILTVSALNYYVKSVLEEDLFLSAIAIKGEISNFSKNFKSGHCYFTLKDENAGIKAVMFRSAATRLAFVPENGMSVLVRGRVSLYERDGAYQLYVDFLFPDGLGSVQLAFEQLKTRLSEEGLFDVGLKKQLPIFPRKIGLITSKTGAALQDILKVATKRCPDADFLLYPVNVQGDIAENEIAEAVAFLDKDANVDVIIIARGGGSAEDLWVFNSEKVARAVFAAVTPVVSAIGHEIDFTILDFVSDYRAPTPSAAAETVLPDLHYIFSNVVLRQYSEIQLNVQSRINMCYNSLLYINEKLQSHNITKEPGALKRELQSVSKQITIVMCRKIENGETKLRSKMALAQLLNPYGVLARGYSIVRTNGENVALPNIKIGQELDILMQGGSFACNVTKLVNKKITNGDEYGEK